MAEVKKENWFKRTWGKVKKYFRELRSELKKVVWPTPQQVLKNTAIVACCVVVSRRVHLAVRLRCPGRSLTP